MRSRLETFIEALKMNRELVQAADQRRVEIEEELATMAAHLFAGREREGFSFLMLGGQLHRFEIDVNRWVYCGEVEYTCGDVVSA